MTDFRHFVERPFDGEKYIAHCRDDERVLLTDCYKPGHDAVILIGPEGDFSPCLLYTSLMGIPITVITLSGVNLL